MRAREISLSLIAIGLAFAGGGRVGGAQAGADQIAWSYEVVSHISGATVSGCVPSIHFAGFGIDAQGSPAVGWDQSGCGIPLPPNALTNIRVATRDRNAWTYFTLNDVACGIPGCSSIHGHPAMALHPDGRPFLLFAGPGNEFAMGLRILDITGASGPAVLGELLAPPNDVNSTPTIAAAFSSPPGAMPNRARATATYGGNVYLNGSPIDNVSGLLIDYATGPGNSHHIALYSGSSSGVLYSNPAAGPPTLALPTTGSAYGGSIAVSPAGRRHIAHAGGPPPYTTALMHAWSDDGVTWQSEVVDPAFAQRPSIAIDGNANPAIAYWTDGKDLWLARRDNAGVWTRSLVATTSGAHTDINPRLAFDPAGRPHVVYYSNTSRDIIIATGALLPSDAPVKLAVTKAGAGTGTVTAAGGGITCGTDCEEPYARGTTVTLTASADAGFVFGGWTGACTDKGPCVVTVDGVTSVGATFHAPRTGATIVVTTTAQSPGAPGDCTLGEAIQAANGDVAVDACAAGTGADRVVVPPGTFTLTIPTDDFSFGDGDTGLPFITSEITIAGAGADSTTIERAEGAPDFRLLRVRDAGSLTLRDLTLRRGRVAGRRGGALYIQAGDTLIERVVFDANLSGNAGGAMWSNSPTTIRDGQFTGNEDTTGRGGAVSLGPGTIERSTFAGNKSQSSGGAVYIESGVIGESTFSENISSSQGGAIAAGHGPVTAVRLRMADNAAQLGGAIHPGEGSFTLIDSLLDGNHATHEGGAITTMAANGPHLTVVGSTLSHNTAGYQGGAIHVASPVTIRNSTLSGNSTAYYGGALLILKPVDLHNVTITGNHAGSMGGGLLYQPSVQPLTLANTILAGNTAGAYPDCYGSVPLISHGHNLVGNTYGCPIAAAAGDQIGTLDAPIDPLLGPLLDNGGPAPTHEPALTSPATDHGSSDEPGSSATACELVDQRGIARPERAACDIGAVERRNRLPVIAGASVTTPEDSAVDITVTATDEENDAITLAIDTPPAHGTVSGTFPNVTYTPAHNYYGEDSFTIAASDPYGSGSATFIIAVTPVNDPPTPADDHVTVLANGGAQLLHLLDNDSIWPDEGETLSITSTWPAAHGTIAIEPGGSAARYTPNANYVGSDFFLYMVADGNGGESPAFVYVNVQTTADLQIAVAASKDPVHAGERFKYVVTLTNPGPGQASAVNAMLILPADVTVHDTAGCGAVQPGPVFSTVSLGAPTLPSGAAIVCDVTVSRIPAGVFTVSASIVSSGGDPDPVSTNNSMTIFTTNAGPLAIDLVESIGVSDTPTVTPAIMLDVSETIGVSDEGDGGPHVDIPQADLRAALDIVPNPPIAGTSTRWRLTIANDGPAVATSVRATLDFTGSMSYAVVPVECSRTGDHVVCPIAMLAVGASRTFEVVATALAVGPVTLTGHVDAAETDSSPANNAPSTTVTVTEAVDLNVQITGPSTALTGHAVEYFVRVNNQSGATADDVVLTITLPAAATFLASSSSCSRSGVTLTCALGALPVNSPVDVPVTIQTATAGPMQLTATVTSANSDSDTTDNVAVRSTTVAAGDADLGVTVTDAPDPLTQTGGTIAYEVLAANHGPNDATGVVLTADLPPGTTLHSAVGAPGAGVACAYTTATHRVTCSIGSLTDNASSLVTIRVTPTTAAGVIRFRASIAGSQDDLFSVNDVAEESTTVIAHADLVVAELSAPETAHIGDDFSVVYRVRNDGPHAADGVAVEFEMPTTLTFAGASAEAHCESTGGSQGTMRMRCGWPNAAASLAPGSSLSASITLRSDSQGGRTVTARVLSNTDDPAPTNDSRSVSVAVRAEADLRLVSLSGNATMLIGNAYQVAYTVRNEGPQTAGTVVVELDIPDGLGTVAQGSICQSAAGAPAGMFRLHCGPVFVMAANASWGQSLTLRPTTAGTFTIAARIISDADDAVPANDTRSLEVTVRAPQADVRLTTLSGPSSRLVDENLDFMYYVVNDGPEDADNVVVDFDLPTAIAHKISSDVLCSFVGGAPAGQSRLRCPEPSPQSRRLTLRGDAPGVYTITARVSSVTEDPDLTNNTRTFEITVRAPQADMRFSNLSGPSSKLVGHAIALNYDVANDGPDDADNVVVDFDLPTAIAHLVSSEVRCTFFDGAPAGQSRLRCPELSSPFATHIRDLTLRGDTPGTYTITARVSSATEDPDLTNNTRTFELTILNTATGTNVVVAPTAQTSVTFSSVSQAGQTSVSSAPTGPAVPSGFRAGSPAVYYDITTTAGYSAPITVCINYAGVSFAPTNEPRLFHYESGGWVDRTTAVDAATSTVCGSVSSLSPFAVFTRTNRPPDCTLAAPSVATLWPPNHQLVPVAIAGVSDPDGDPTAILVTQILQDEPTNTDNDPSTNVDGYGIGTSSTQLRAERGGSSAPQSNGRLYHVRFSATDPAGASCTGTVRVAVPPDQTKPAIDDGALFDSTMKKP